MYLFKSYLVSIFSSIWRGPFWYNLKGAVSYSLKNVSLLTFILLVVFFPCVSSYSGEHFLTCRSKLGIDKWHFQFWMVQLRSCDGLMSFPLVDSVLCEMKNDVLLAHTPLLIFCLSLLTSLVLSHPCFLFPFSAILGIEPRVSRMLDKCCPLWPYLYWAFYHYAWFDVWECIYCGWVSKLAL